MQPRQGDKVIKIPVTFDVNSNFRVRNAGIKLWLFVVVTIWVISSITALVVAETWLGYLFPLYSLFLLSYIVRYIIFRERYYRSRRKELMENDFMFDQTLFWNIYEISSRFPHFVTFETGAKGLFVAFDKGVVIGRGENSDYYHHEALTLAYQQVLDRGLELYHIDYMDVLGKDSRMDSLFELAEKAKNDDIRRVLIRMYDYTASLMNNSFASYDVYVFVGRGREEDLWFEIEQCLTFFSQANYLRYQVLDQDALTKLVESLMNVKEFSANRANTTIFRKLNFYTSYVTPIWVEKDGVRTVLNKTLEEKAELKRLAEAEKKVKKKGSILTRRKDKEVKEQEINLFGVGFDEDEFEDIKKNALDPFKESEGDRISRRTKKVTAQNNQKFNTTDLKDDSVSLSDTDNVKKSSNYQDSDDKEVDLFEGLD